MVTTLNYLDPEKETDIIMSKIPDLDRWTVANMVSVDKNSSPLGFRACFEVENSLAMVTETYTLIEAVPLEAPVWFDCFDADALGLALEEGRALAFLGTRDIADGVDRVVAIMDDGRGFAWHQLNEKYEK